MKRPDIDTKNITDEEKALLRESMGKEYGIKALKIRLLTNEILFLDEKTGEFEWGSGVVRFETVYDYSRT